MIIKVKLHNGQKTNNRGDHPPVDGLRFSCAGESCAMKESCPRWNGRYREKHSNN